MRMPLAREGTRGVWCRSAGMYLGLAAGIGAGVDALIQRNHVIYGPMGAAQRRLTVSPLLSGDRRGVAVSLRF